MLSGYVLVTLAHTSTYQYLNKIIMLTSYKRSALGKAFAVCTFLAIGSLGALQASAATFNLSTWVYDPDNTGTAVSTVIASTTTTQLFPQTKDDCKNNGWMNGSSTLGFKNQGQCVSYFEQHGPNSTSTTSYTLSLQKNASTTTNSAAGAFIETGTTTLTSLSFTYQGYCGAGAPRFNVYTDTEVYYFFGCTYGTHTDLGNGWTQVTFTDADAVPADGVTAFPGFGSTTVTGIDVVQDEEGQVLLKDIMVNGMTVSML